MRVAIVVPFLDELGGTEQAAASLAARFRDEGLGPRIVTCRHLRAGSLTSRETPGIDVIRFPILQRPPLFDLTWVVPGALYLAATRPAAIVAYHMPTGGVLAALAAGLSGAPFAVVTQGSAGIGDVSVLRRSSFARFRSRAVARADFVASVNEEVDAELVAVGIRRERIRRIPNSCDVERFRPPVPAERAAARRALGIGEDEVVAVFSGRLHRDKQLPTLFEALARTRPGLRLVLVGDGVERAALTTLAADLAIGDRIELLGRADDVRAVLHGGDLFCLPSVSEGISLALLEAMATGLPAVVSDVPGNRDVVTDGADGLLARSGDAGAWAAALDRLAGDAALRRRLGTQAVATVVDGYRRETVEGQYVDWARGASRP